MEIPSNPIFEKKIFQKEKLKSLNSIINVFSFDPDLKKSRNDLNSNIFGPEFDPLWLEIWSFYLKFMSIRN